MKILSLTRLNWANQPLSRFLLLFFLGLICAYYIDFNFKFLAFIILFSLALYGLIYLRKNTSRLVDCLLSFLILLCGCFVGNRYSHRTPQLTNHQLYHKQFYLVRVSSEPTIKDSTLSFVGDFFMLNDKSFQFENQSQLRVRSTIDHCKNVQLKIGQLLLVHSKLFYPQVPILEGSFNYADYLHKKGISVLCRFSNNDFLDLHAIDYSYRQLLVDFRNHLVNSLKVNGLKDDQLSIASALLLGARSEISEDLNEAYSNSGITHVLAVSGMHVGLVFLAVGFFLKRIKNKAYACILSLAFLWSYACLTGLSPSVIRAAWMFSFISIGKLFRSGHQKWNSIAASALLMLIIDPFIWLDAGFQLSFFAVWGIVALGKLPEVFITRYKYFNYFLEAGWISCIAQLCTIPISLFIFGKFPIYFLLANLLVVPLSTVLTYWGITCFMVLPIPQLAQIFCSVLGWGIDAMNFIAYQISQLPSSTFDGIHFNIFQSIWLSTSIYIIASRFLTNQKKFKLIVSISIIYSFLNLANFLVIRKSSTTIYYSNNTFGILQQNGHTVLNHIFFGDGALKNRSMKSFVSSLYQSSIQMHCKRYNYGNCKAKTLLLESNVKNFESVLFVSPSDKSLNPFDWKISKRRINFIFLLEGGSYKFKQMWRLSGVRQQIPVLELNKSQPIFLKLSKQ